MPFIYEITFGPFDVLRFAVDGLKRAFSSVKYVVAGEGKECYKEDVAFLGEGKQYFVRDHGTLTSLQTQKQPLDSCLMIG